jgi:elongation factor 1-beta
MARNVIATFTLMPESVEVDLDAIMTSIKAMKDIGNVTDVKTEPVAFGLKAIKVLCVVPDEGGLLEEIERKFQALPGVQSAENSGVTLI